MIDWLKDLIVPIRTRNPRFGAIRYLRDARFWEGKCAFRPIGGEVDVIISGEPSGPTEEQCTLFDELENRYDSIWPGIREKLTAEATRHEFRALMEFVVVCVHIPAQSGEGGEICVSYETRPPSWNFTVHLWRWTAREIVAEC